MSLYDVARKIKDNQERLQSVAWGYNYKNWDDKFLLTFLIDGYIIVSVRITLHYT